MTELILPSLLLVGSEHPNGIPVAQVVQGKVAAKAGGLHVAYLPGIRHQRCGQSLQTPRLSAGGAGSEQRYGKTAIACFVVDPLLSPLYLSYLYHGVQDRIPLWCLCPSLGL